MPADDQSHFTLGGGDAKNASANNDENGLDALWNEWQQLDDEGLDDKSDEGRNLRVSIKEYIEDNGLNITLGRTKTNLDLLNEIEDALAGDSSAAPAEEEEEETPAPAPSRRSAPAPAEEEEDDDEPADTAPAPTRRQRSDDTNEPAVRTERRAARPARRR